MTANWMSNISRILKIWEIHPPLSLFLQIYTFALQNCQGRKGKLVPFDHPTPHLTLLLFIFVWAWFQPQECQCFHINWELGISSFSDPGSLGSRPIFIPWAGPSMLKETATCVGGRQTGIQREEKRERHQGRETWRYHVLGKQWKADNQALC